MTVAESLGGGGDKASGEDGCDAESEHPAMSPSSCRMAHSRSPPPPLANWWLVRLWMMPLTLGGQGRAGGDGLVTAPALPATAATSF
jgi:hypothetical protein